MKKNITYVMLTFDIDGETLWTSRDKNNQIGPVMRSQGRYGPEIGLPRILKLLEEVELSATFFITGQVIDRYTDACKWILDYGHEIGHHNYFHEWPSKVSSEIEIQDFEKGLEAIHRLTGRSPSGYRAPGWEFSQTTFQLLVDNNFQYSSNMMDDERPYEHIKNGNPTGIIEFPCSWILDDAAFFMHGLTYNSPIFPPSMVFEQWKNEFDGLYNYEDGRIYVLTMHPQIIGRPSRMKMLEELIHYMCSMPNVLFCKGEELSQKLNNLPQIAKKDFISN